MGKMCLRCHECGQRVCWFFLSRPRLSEGCGVAGQQSPANLSGFSPPPVRWADRLQPSNGGGVGVGEAQAAWGLTCGFLLWAGALLSRGRGAAGTSSCTWGGKRPCHKLASEPGAEHSLPITAEPPPRPLGEILSSEREEKARGHCALLGVLWQGDRGRWGAEGKAAVLPSPPGWTVCKGPPQSETGRVVCRVSQSPSLLLPAHSLDLTALYKAERQG